MSKYPQFIDNERKTLADTLRLVAKDHDTLRIATGYWDVPGTTEIIDSIKDYKHVKILIGKEPIAHRYQVEYGIDPEAPENLFPDANIKHDLIRNAQSSEINAFRHTVTLFSKMQKEGRLEVRIFRTPRLHAKAYIFGDLDSANAVGVIGSSNFTRAGLTRNAELNYLEDDSQKVTYIPRSAEQENGHIIWFENLWEEAEEWTGEFSEILANSPLGQLCYGPYDVYIKTLMEVFPEELVEAKPFDDYIQDYLHPFQNQNALSLIRKLKLNGVAMLSDSVGLGKTITAAAIIDQYIKEGLDNIVLILPSSLQNQWIDELESEPWDLKNGRDFTIYTQENINRLNEAVEKSRTRKAYEADVNLFIIDEAHNLRNSNSKRYQAVLSFLQENPSASVLMLTATPINNSLMDFVAQIQLGSKGELSSYNVKYKASKHEAAERIDFFEAARRIQTQYNRAIRNNRHFDWSLYKPTLVSGIRHYLVRSTRQGVVRRQAYKGYDEDTKLFPDARVVQFSYKYTDAETKIIDKCIDKNINKVFEGIDPRRLNLELMTEITQRTQHPLDIVKNIQDYQSEGNYERALKYYHIDDDYRDVPIKNRKADKTTVITTLYRLINLIGFTPYRAHSYEHKFYAKPLDIINQAIDNTSEDASSLRLEFSIHNMLQTTWLKRLESSTNSLLESVNYYEERLDKFNYWLNEGYVVKLSDLDTLNDEYEADVQAAKEDRIKYELELEEAIKLGKETEVEEKGVRVEKLDPDKYNVQALLKDIARDKKIIKVLQSILAKIATPEHDRKLQTFLKRTAETVKSNKYGQKVIVFSFYADTIKYLEKVVPEIMRGKVKDFDKRSAFVHGQSSNSKHIAQMFSPESQKYTFKRGETEIDFLFATDVLSEGQNLQDAGILVNYDLHWNPVRMIQRNGRINRLSSKYDEILIANARPHDELEEYLKLLNRLENKIDGISNTIGSDTSILGEAINPIEFSENIEEAYGIYSQDSDKATAAMAELEAEDSIIDWIDIYSLELREFIDSHSEEEINRIKNIPVGKWNYLPKRKDNENKAYGLFKEHSKNVVTGEKISNAVFVEYEESKDSNIFAKKAGVTAKIVSDDEVLAHVKTNPEDNKRKQDTIELDREKLMRAGKQESKTNFGSQANYFKIEPRHEKALLALNKYINYPDLPGLVSKNISKLNEKKRFERLSRKINQQIKTQGRLNLSIVNRAMDLFIELEEKDRNNDKLEDVEGVLFYAAE